MRTYDISRMPGSRRGFTLLELTVVLGIIALMAAAIMLFFGNASNAQKTDDSLAELAAIEQAMHGMYAGQFTYGAADFTAVVAGSKQLPAKWSTGTGLYDPFGGTVAVTSLLSTHTVGTTFTVTMNAMSDQACIKMAVMDYGTTLASTTMNSVLTAPYIPLTPAQASANCAANPNNHTLSWEFF